MMEPPTQALFLILTLVVSATGQSISCPAACDCPSAVFITCDMMTDGFPVFADEDKPLIRNLIVVGGSVPFINQSTLVNFTLLSSLDIQSAGLQSIAPGAFEHLGAFASLDFEGNELTEIVSGAFAGSLRSVSLPNNRITTIEPGAFTGVQETATIDLENNNLSSIPEGVFTARYHSLTLAGNPFVCDCRFRWLPDYIASFGPTIFSGECSEPSGIVGESLNSLTLDQLICQCDPPCAEGMCNTTVGVCECDKGWIGVACDVPCQNGTYGPDCQFSCQCVNSDLPCHHVNGTCYCNLGYTGNICDESCSGGFFGDNCEEVCLCQNGAACHFVTGECTCTVGWNGTYCDQPCGQGFYGLGCSEVCVCETGHCNPMNGTCTCEPGYFGADCSHNCSAASECADVNREPCSLNTPENTCGPCFSGHVGTPGYATDLCISCVRTPELFCAALNREPCSLQADTCGPCYTRHVTASGEGENTFSNEPCFDPCLDGVMNYDETDVDCGGPLCRPCGSHQTCALDIDCGPGSACVGVFQLPSGIPYEYLVDDLNTCTNATVVADAVLERIRSTFVVRFALPDVSGLEEYDQYMEHLQDELEYQFQLPGVFQSTAVTAVYTRPGQYLYQLVAAFRSGLSEQDTEEAYGRIVANIHSGRLKGTAVFTKENGEVLFNF